MSPLTSDGQGVCLPGGSLAYTAMPAMVTAHLQHVPSTQVLEIAGSKLRAEGFDSASSLRFVKAVCTWGGYPGIGGRVEAKNTDQHVADCLRAACELLDSPTPNHRLALIQVNKISELGQPSFASKQLRLLRPDECGVLDSIIASKVGYALTAADYQRYCDDLAEAAAKASTKAVVNPMKRDAAATWYPADIDMAIFAALRGWTITTPSVVGQT
jgi:hypothetical protein